MTFSKKSISTNLSKEEVLGKIETLTKPLSPKNTFNFNTKERHQFEGRFDDFSFTLFPLFDYGLNQLLRPKIVGQIETEGVHTMVKLEFHIPKNIMYVMLLLVGLAIFIFTKTTIDIDKMMIFSAITMSVFYFGYLYKVNKSIQIIESELN